MEKQRMALKLTTDGELVDVNGREWQLEPPDGREVEQPVWPRCVVCGEGVDITTQPHYAHERTEDEPEGNTQALFAILGSVSDKPDVAADPAAAITSSTPDVIAEKLMQRCWDYLWDYQYLHASPRCVTLGTEEPRP